MVQAAVSSIFYWSAKNHGFFSDFNNGDRLTLLNPFCFTSKTAHSFTPGQFYLLHCHHLSLGMVKRAQSSKKGVKMSGFCHIRWPTQPDQLTLSAFHLCMNLNSLRRVGYLGMIQSFYKQVKPCFTNYQLRGLAKRISISFKRNQKF